MEPATINFEKKDSVELKMNAKGEISYNAKIYWDSAEEDIKDVINRLIDIDMKIKENFIDGDN